MLFKLQRHFQITAFSFHLITAGDSDVTIQEEAEKNDCPFRVHSQDIMFGKNTDTMTPLR